MSVYVQYYMNRTCIDQHCCATVRNVILYHMVPHDCTAMQQTSKRACLYTCNDLNIEVYESYTHT
jgi:hypothetical protein